MKYYLDTCIWRDHYENRLGRNGRPLGLYASRLFEHILKKRHTLLYSEFTIRELKIDFDEEEINNMLKILFISKILEKVEVCEKDYKAAKIIGIERDIPKGDVLHAILARKSKAILVSQDSHFQKLKDIVEVKRPEEII